MYLNPQDSILPVTKQEPSKLPGNEYLETKEKIDKLTEILDIGNEVGSIDNIINTRIDNKIKEYTDNEIQKLDLKIQNTINEVLEKIKSSNTESSDNLVETNGNNITNSQTEITKLNIDK